MNLNKFKKNLKKEYNDTFKDELEIIEPKKVKRTRLTFKPAFAFMLAIIYGILVIQHIGIEIYNFNIEKQNEKVLNRTDKDIIKIDNNKNIKSQLNYIGREKTSILETIFSIQLTGCGAMDAKPNASGGQNNNGSSYDTNIQEEGVYEADIIKCDGNYIYSLIGYRYLKIFDLKGNIVDLEYTKSSELYIYNEKVICIGSKKTDIFSFNGVELQLIDTIEHADYSSSRLVDGKLYIVTYDYLNNILNKESFENLYYDNCINPNGVISMCKYDLDTKEYSKIEVITSYNAILYASDHNFYIASRIHSNGNYTFISIIDYDLKPLGSVAVEGTINNQFSIDEHNNYIRVVSTDTTKGPLNINQISIFSLETLDRVGYLNEGIGLEYHTVRSVRYDDNTCYVVTYMNRDPLYEIDLTDVTNPKIVSIYEAPGYSTYLHTFEINNQKYAFGIGYDDYRYMKISVYIDNGEKTTQIGKDVVMVPQYIDLFDKNTDYYIVEQLSDEMAENHKSLFIYNDNQYLYIGGNVGINQYTIFKIDVTQEERVISVHKEYKIDTYSSTRAFLIEGKLYIVKKDSLIIDDWS